MSNKEIIKLFYEKMWSEGDLIITDQIIHPEYHPRDVGMPEKGPALLKKEIGYFRSIFPDLHYRIIEMVEDGDKICVRYQGNGTQKGNGWGFEPTDKKIEFDGAAIFTLESGLIIDSWRSYCLFDIFVQTGHIPPLWELADALKKD
ncbi:MAG: ester cyclase [Candidatus Heimdallarchaeota archaeon]|nr:ester cyclase [Candidatus Heimdallarchaeota archaeon]